MDWRNLVLSHTSLINIFYFSSHFLYCWKYFFVLLYSRKVWVGRVDWRNLVLSHTSLINIFYFSSPFLYCWKYFFVLLYSRKVWVGRVDWRNLLLSHTSAITNPGLPLIIIAPLSDKHCITPKCVAFLYFAMCISLHCNAFLCFAMHFSAIFCDALDDRSSMQTIWRPLHCK